MTIEHKHNAGPRKKSLLKRRSLSGGILPLKHPHSISLFQHLLDQSGDEVMVVDNSGIIVYANEATFKGLGYPAKDVLNQPITQFLKEKISVQKWKKKVFAQIIKNKAPQRLLIERVVKGNKTQVIDVTASLLNYAGADYIVSTARDVTAHNQLQRELKESEELYRLLSEQAAEGIFILSLEGYIMYSNKAGEEMLKLPAKKIKGAHFEKFVHPEEVEKAWQSFKRVAKGNTIVRDEIHIVNSLKEKIPVEFTASPVVKEGKIYFIHAIARDISRKRQIEKLVAEAEKMKSFQNFIAGTMQEIYHPLKAIMGHAQELVDKYSTRQFEYIGYKEYTDMFSTIKNMRNQLKYCVDTSGRLININKKKAGLSKNFTNVNAVLQDLLLRFKDIGNVSDIQIVARLKDNLPVAAIAPLEMQQVVENILANAIQAIPAKGKIIVKSWFDAQEDHVFVQVEDEGVGIAKENLARIFDPFFTTKNRGAEKNSGLGLSIVYSIIKAHNGAVNITSSLRKGTLVTVSIPAYRNGKEAALHV